jgi:hypothetical protein
VYHASYRLNAWNEATSRHVGPSPARTLYWPGELEVPGSNPGAPTDEKPRVARLSVLLDASSHEAGELEQRNAGSDAVGYGWGAS